MPSTTATEESLVVRTFDEAPSLEEFSSQIEPKNVPAVFKGCVKDWRAYSCWNPSNGGLDYLLDRVGSSIVEGMLSESAPIFYGDIRSHMRVPIPFSAFINSCKKQSQSEDGCHRSCSESMKPETVASDEDYSSLLADIPKQVYLAQGSDKCRLEHMSLQVPILNSENEERVQLEMLREDITIPSFLATKALTSINLWMNNEHSRSSSHYDPHHNLLCVVAGCKRVVLWPPSASSKLYPMPIYGEASNHSSVALDKPDLSSHPRAEDAFGRSQKVILQGGDALFIPEGWFHQVGSDALTIAVNIWWRSTIMCSMSEHMDAYYLRNRMLYGSSVPSSHVTYQNEPMVSKTELENKEFEGCNQHQNDILSAHGPQTLPALHELVAIVHDRVKVGNAPLQPTTAHNAGISSNTESTSIQVGDLFSLADDPVAKILWNIEPVILQIVFLTMVQKFPRTLEALITHLLSPIGAEVLTRKFDQLDQVINEEERSKFYQDFYSVFDHQSMAMDAILNGKESFARQVQLLAKR
ncbi:Lysine-specific demethylase JMJ31-like protein [Drosera capensis]